MARQFRLAIVLALLAATAVAFVVTERLKLEPSEITGTLVSHEFAPLCDCDTAAAEISFRLRKAEVLTLRILDADDSMVRTLIFRRHVPRGRVRVTWNGRDDAGQIVSDGVYRPSVTLRNAARTVILPNPIRVDTVPPRVTVVSVRPHAISPDGDGRNDHVSVTYRQSERGKPLLFVNGKLRVRGKFSRLDGKLDWYGKVHGRAVKPRAYALTLTVRDVAGNLAVQPFRTIIRVRYLELAPRVIRVRVHRRFRVAVQTDARTVRWRLGRRSGRARPPIVRLRAPARPGSYALVVGYDDHRVRAVVLVRKR